MICPYCQKEALWVSNEEVYGNRYGKSYMCYFCKDCDAYVGCHQNTTQPLGIMANRELRQLRMQCHALFDPFWKEGGMTRKNAYRFLVNKTGVRHISQTTKEECERVINFFARIQKNN